MKKKIANAIKDNFDGKGEIVPDFTEKAKGPKQEVAVEGVAKVSFEIAMGKMLGNKMNQQLENNRET